MKEKLKILICDDHAILLEGLKACLQRMPFIGSVIVSNNPTDALNLLKEQSSNIDLCITDLDFAQDASGLMLIDHIHEHACHIRILVYTSHEEIWNINAIMHSGADGVVFKSCTPDELQHAIRCIYDGDKYFCERFQQLVRHIEMQIPATTDHLTTQETNVLHLLARGLRAGEIGKKLYVSVNTVNTHKAHFLSKFNASNTTELIIKAFVKGIVELKLQKDMPESK